MVVVGCYDQRCVPLQRYSAWPSMALGIPTGHLAMGTQMKSRIRKRAIGECAAGDSEVNKAAGQFARTHVLSLTWSPASQQSRFFTVAS